jgi:signal transduction histidine kinase
VRSLTLLRVLAAALATGGLLVVAGAVLTSAALTLLVVGLALLLGAAACWRLTGSIAREVTASHVWSETERLQRLLHERVAAFGALPAPVAVWAADGTLVMASAAWVELGVSTARAPGESELTIGEPARVFVVETSRSGGDGHLVVLREVTRERQALQAKDELLAIVSHELRTPLSAIRGYGQLMARQLATVQDQVQRLDQLIGDVLDTARAEGGRLVLRREAVVIGDVLRGVADRFRAANPQRLLELGLADCPIVEGDAARLDQVLDNLLANAAKYSPGDTPITLRAAASEGGTWLRIDVVDRGIGIAREHLPRLFERFYRVPGQDKSAPSGFGLGLSIVRDLVEAHGGHVEASSGGPGRGATFSVLLPAAQVGSSFLSEGGAEHEPAAHVA